MTEFEPTAAGERMLETAIRLFSTQGIQNTGVEKIIAESGSARGTLYHQFGSKSGLVAAALEAEGAEWREWFFASIDENASSAKGKLLAMFDVLEAWFEEEAYSGCLFMNAVAECRSQDPAISRATMGHKKRVKAKIRALASEAGAARPADLAQQLDLLIDGLIITALVTKSSSCVGQGREAAKQLIEASVRG